jgi:hypothetical protein
MEFYVSGVIEKCCVKLFFEGKKKQYPTDIFHATKYVYFFGACSLSCFIIVVKMIIA